MKKLSTPARTMEKDGFTDEEEWLIWLHWGERLKALVQALNSDFRPMTGTSDRSQRVQTLFNEALRSLEASAGAILDNVPETAREGCSRPLVLIGELNNFDHQQMLFRYYSDEVFSIEERKPDMSSMTLSEMSSCLLSSTLEKLCRKYKAAMKEEKGGMGQ